MLPTHAYLTGPLLRDVSRSFYLTLRILPAELRPQISLAYLLARASDTIADTPAVPKPQRVHLLREFLAGGIPAVEPGAADTPAETRLLQHLGDYLAMLATFSAADQALIRQLLQTIVTGQIFDLEQFPSESAQQIGVLNTEDDLDRYTYMVAGCVGEFWTKMCAAHVRGLEDWKDERMEEAGVRFGNGLQLVNILRDIPRDLRIGRCYLPVREPDALLNPVNFVTIQPIYEHWLDTAVAHLDAGWQYTLQIPPAMAGLRLACVWPIWIGLKTIARLRHANPLDPARRVKVPRIEVYGLMLESYLLCRNDATLDEKYQRLRTKAVPPL